MAIWLLSCFVAMGIETCGFVTKCWKMHCCDYIKVPRCCGSLYNILVFLRLRAGNRNESCLFRFGTETLFWSCVLQFCRCRSQCNGCIKIPRYCGCLRNTMLFCSWKSWIVLEWLIQGCASDLSAGFLSFGIGNFPFIFLSASWKKHAAVDAGLYVSDGETTINIRYIVIKFCCNA